MPLRRKDAKTPRRGRTRFTRGQPFGPAPSKPATPPSDLRHVEEAAIGSMAPGDVIFLGDAESLRFAVESIFFAVLACPACGTLGLITSAQFGGAVAVTCASSQCSCRFRIDDERRFVYLPVN